MKLVSAFEGMSTVTQPSRHAIEDVLESWKNTAAPQWNQDEPRLRLLLENELAPERNSAEVVALASEFNDVGGGRGGGAGPAGGGFDFAELDPAPEPEPEPGPEQLRRAAADGRGWCWY